MILFRKIHTVFAFSLIEKRLLLDYRIACSLFCFLLSFYITSESYTNMKKSFEWFASLPEAVTFRAGEHSLVNIPGLGTAGSLR